MSGWKLLIGVDEAGYGPSMGPLTICATVWRVPIAFDATQMADLLEPEFQCEPIKSNSSHIPIGDSKNIHKDGLAVEGLILGSRFLSFEIDGAIESEWDRRIACYAYEDWMRLPAIPWYVKRPCMNTEILDRIIRDQPAYFCGGSKRLKQESIQLVGIRMRIFDELEFNRQLDRTGNKSTLLSEASLNLVKLAISEFANKQEMVEVYCDKHGGRNRYQSILTFVFNEAWFAIVCESRACSRYTAKSLRSPKRCSPQSWVTVRTPWKSCSALIREPR